VVWWRTQLFAGYRMSAVGESCEVLLLHLTVQAPLLGKLAVPLAAYMVTFGVVIALGIRKLFFVICLSLTRT
jgi:hypothetical protein